MKRLLGLGLCTVFLAGCAASSADAYEKAYSKTQELNDYTMNIVTNVTVSDGEKEETQSTVQLLEKGKTDDGEEIFAVSTDEYSPDGTASESGYTYYNGNYYISMPGIKYYLPTDVEAARKSIDDLTNIIALPYGKMYNAIEKDGEYTYQVEGSDVSQYVWSLLQTAADSFGEETFKAENISGKAVVEDGYVKVRSFEAVYRSPDGSKSFQVDIDTTLTDTSAKPEKPKADEYAKIAD